MHPQPVILEIITGNQQAVRRVFYSTRMIPLPGKK